MAARKKPSRENNWLRGLDAWLDKQGPEVWYVNIHGGLWQKSGLPDRLILIQGRLFAVEAKQEGKKPTVLQTYILQKIQAAGGIVLPDCTSAEAVITAIKAWGYYSEG